MSAALAEPGGRTLCPFTQPRPRMLKKRYYYDPRSCTYVEAKWVGRWVWSVLASGIVLAVALSWVVDLMGETPEEVALKNEKAILQEELVNFGDRLNAYSHQLDALEESDQQLYRMVFGMEPISEDIRRVGVGGSDPYEEFDRLGVPTGALLRETAQELDQLESRIHLQTASLRDLLTFANEQKARNDQMPAILPASGPVVSGFGLRKDPLLGVMRMHHGVDISVPEGTPVVASAAGRVVKKEFNASYGNYVLISHPASETETLYAHLSSIDDAVRIGSTVERGERIGWSGNTGRSVGPHVHFEVRAAGGSSTNPILYMAPSMTPEEYEKLKADSERATQAFDY